jgi:drug/metabolite transporter (DMT)-like permease
VLVIGALRRRLPPGLWKAALAPAVFNALGQMLFGMAPYFIGAGLMTFALRMQIIFVAIGAAILFPAERALLRRPAFIGGMALVVIATLLTVTLGPDGVAEADLSDRKVRIGIAMSVGSGIAYAIYALFVRKLMHGMPALTSFAAVSQYTAVLLVVPMLFFAKNLAGVMDHGLQALDLEAWKFGLLILSAVIGIGLGHTMYFFSIARLGVAVSTGVVQLQPIVVSLLSIRLFGEPFTRAQWITGGIAVAGAIWMLAVQHRHAQRTPA